MEPTFKDFNGAVSYDFNKDLMAIVRRKLQETALRRDELIEAFVAKYGFDPAESVLHEQHCGDGIIRYWMEKQSPLVTPKLLEDAAFAIETLRAMANPGIPLLDPKLLRHVAETLRRREIVIPE